MKVMVNWVPTIKMVQLLMYAAENESPTTMNPMISLKRRLTSINPIKHPLKWRHVLGRNF